MYMNRENQGKKKERTKESGSIIIQVITFAAVSILILSGLVGWGAMSVRVALHSEAREQAIQIAEAGIDYYRWHLAHAPSDFEDGTATSGPYVHDYMDKNGVKVGTFTLTITPPLFGSTLVTIRSTGKVLRDESVARTIEARLAKPSLAKYSVAANATMRFGSGTEIFGPVHSNGGIRFDALAHNIVSSAVAQYNDPDFDDCNNNVSFGVHTCLNPKDPSPPAAVPSRPDVFQVGRQFPVPALDFAGLTSDLAQMKTDAQTGGRYYAPSGGLGYLIVLSTNDTFDIFRVNTLVARGSCRIVNQPGWGTWSIGTTGSSKTLIEDDASFPLNGIIFVEDHLWVEGRINTARLTIAAAKFPDNPATRRSITVNNDLIYTNYNGQDVIALIAQNNFNVGLRSLTTLRIDAALIAQNGRAGRYYYGSSCSPYHLRSTLTLYGMIGTAQRYGFAYTDGTGYAIRNITYDANLLYGPPPSFPLTTDQYQTISWDEL
ncbi:MAG: hypothetical protein AAB869_00365 [Patescibacteria group bacterium]